MAEAYSETTTGQTPRKHGHGHPYLALQAIASGCGKLAEASSNLVPSRDAVG